MEKIELRRRPKVWTGKSWECGIIRKKNAGRDKNFKTRN